MSGNRTPLDTRRNRMAVRLCNLILRLVASTEYRVTLTAIILRGMDTSEGEKRLRDRAEILGLTPGEAE